jgi:hypothetical protein
MGTMRSIRELQGTGRPIQRKTPGRRIKAQEDTEKKVRGQAFSLWGFLMLSGERMQSLEEEEHFFLPIEYWNGGEAWALKEG